MNSSYVQASCVEYIILVSDNLSSLFPNTHMRFAGTNLDPHQLFALTAAVIVLPTVWLRNLSLLSYISGFLILIIVVLSFKFSLSKLVANNSYCFAQLEEYLQQ